RVGLAWWNKKYSWDDEDLERLEAAARRARRGLWRQQNPVAPWVWRRRYPNRATEEPEEPLAPAREPVEVLIVHTNDLHGQVYAQTATWLDKENPPKVGGFGTLASMIRKRRAEAQSASQGFLYLDAGDIWQGTPEGNLTEGAIVVEWFNLLSLDALALGNHDFDAGADRIGTILGRGRFPSLAANLTVAKTGKLPDFARSHVDLQVKDLSVTIIGITAADTKQRSTERATRGFEFLPEIATAKREVGRARARGANIVILLSHCGAPVDQQLARAVSGIDVIVGGHSHEGINVVDPETGTLVHATWGKGTSLGHVLLRYDPQQETVTSKTAWLEDALAESWPTDEPTEKLIAKYTGEIAKTMDVVIGEVEEPLVRTRDHLSTPLGNWITDLMREATDADIALTNKTGIRADVDAGPISVREMFQVSPFGNTIVTMTLSGREIRESLEIMLSAEQLALEVSGLWLRYDLDRPIGERVVELKVAGRPVKDDDSFKVATNSFLAQGGDGHRPLAGTRDRMDTGLDVFDLQVEDVKRRGKLTVSKGHRIGPTVAQPVEEPTGGALRQGR
ncbi:bifunctional metallophosphatase/5'-nucleotidase, partial [Planctomycetota bacterium]